MENTAEEIKRLQRCVNDLISVLALPALWGGSQPSQMVGTLLDVLLGMLRLDLAYARLSDSLDGPPIEVARSAHRQHPALQPQQVGQALGRWLTGDQPASRFVVPNPHGEGEVSIASFSLGLQDEVGVLVAGSRRSDFPTDIERLLLRVAANQAGMGLQEARRSREQRRVAEALEQRVAERTRQLTGINEELRRSEAYLAEAQRLSHTGSVGWTASTGEMHWSEETFRIFQYGRTTEPTVERVLQRAHPEDAALVRQTLERARHDKKDFDLEHRLLMPDGSVKHVQLVVHAMADESGNVEFVGAMMDITERKRGEEAQQAQEREREEMQRQLQQAAKMEAIGRLAGGIAHDFNNILGAILGYGELAQKHLDEGNAVRRHVDQMMQAGARGKGLVERILAFSRSGLGERVPVHVQSVVEETLEILAAPLASDVRLERQLDAGDTAVVGDATQLHQVAMNLCTNALQAMEHGGVLRVLLDRVAVPERRLLSHGTLSPGPHVRLSVSDTGSGIPPAVLERMFDPFFTTKGIGDGTGLGLSLVHGLVADFGGAIDVATRADVGTTFTVWLPAAGETPRLLAEPAGELPQGNGETVMIVDDQRSLVALAEETLAALGYEPAGFDSSVAALEAFRAEPQRFDLVLTDETMPDLSGVELAREIRRVRPELPIVLMSGYSGAQLSERARAAGVAELLRKPLVRRDIAEALGRALHSTIT